MPSIATKNEPLTASWPLPSWTREGKGMRSRGGFDALLAPVCAEGVVCAGERGTNARQNTSRSRLALIESFTFAALGEPGDNLAQTYGVEREEYYERQPRNKRIPRWRRGPAALRETAIRVF